MLSPERPPSAALNDRPETLRSASRKELASRYEIYKEAYEGVLSYEAALAVDMVRTMYLPSVAAQMNELARTVKSVEGVEVKTASVKKTLATISALNDKALEEVEALEQAIKDGKPGLEKRKLMGTLR